LKKCCFPIFTGLVSSSVQPLRLSRENVAAMIVTSSFAVLAALIVVYILVWHRYFITIVQSESMRPALRRGDIVISSRPIDIRLKDIVLAKVVCFFSATIREQ
jgi:signal peptidase I